MELTLERLLEINSQQAALIKELRNQIESQAKIIAKQSELIAQLRDKLNPNSQNSSLPPSKDLYRIKNQEKPKSDKNPGAQPGHTPNHRPYDKPDQIIKCVLPEKCNCGGEITVSKKFSVYTKIDLPKIVPQVTHYHLERGKCRICLKKQTAALPTGVTKDLLGPRAKAAISTLSGVYGQSKKEVKKYYKTYSTLMLVQA